MENKVEFKVYGKYALFTDPLTKIGGEKCSYQIPTYQALKGIMESVYWKPTLIWIIDKVRVMKPIRTQTKSAKPLNYGGVYPSARDRRGKGEPINTLSIYNYLVDVEYQIQAHFEWNLNRRDLIKDCNENKHFFVAKRMIERGGRRDIFLGTRECQGYVEPCHFGEGNGFYDRYGELTFDLMFHGFDYPDEYGKNELHARFSRPEMINGVVNFKRPEECEIRKFVKPMSAKPPVSIGLEEEELLDGYTTEEVDL
ncbi:type I-C CRISPR-associated protein Cas5c [Desulfitobacterium sp.]|uniref:type I-C CRISPR-associated protein Cas5c n=1 Tax=Desulfitobacterium sp. TaxID=49981 RepID=UPI002B7B15B3|nr:type I-C CRISPR-associated protein Cas5c [Desulfitobacterium sp.]HVJ48742.1 type I-C CRISPR-associated protein Cas5c [Desulfitobacterium sp.]